MTELSNDLIHEVEDLKKQVAMLTDTVKKLSEPEISDTAASEVTTCGEVSTSKEELPIQGVQPAHPVQSVQSNQSAQPTQPMQPAQPAQAEQPVASTQPTSQYQNGACVGQAPVPPAGFNQAQYHTAQQQWSPANHGAGYANHVPVVHAKDHVAAALLAIFLGAFGVHKFYLGYNTAGFIMLGVTLLGSLLTFGFAAAVVWLIGLVEGIVYLVKTQAEFEQMYIRNKREWF